MSPAELCWLLVLWSLIGPRGGAAAVELPWAWRRATEEAWLGWFQARSGRELDGG